MWHWKAFLLFNFVSLYGGGACKLRIWLPSDEGAVEYIAYMVS